MFFYHAPVGRFVFTYLVDVAKVEASVGSCDQALMDGLAKRDLEVFGNTRIEALKKVVDCGLDDGPYSVGDQAQYVMAVWALCEYFAVAEPNCYGPYQGDWLSRFDRALSRLGVDAVEVSAFEGSGVLGDFDLAGFGIGGGAWTHQDCKDAVAQWDSVRWRRWTVRPVILETLEEEWMQYARRAANTPGQGLMGWLSV